MAVDKKAAFIEIEAVAASRDMSLTALAEAIGLGKDTLTKARQRGRTPSLETIQELQDFLNISRIAPPSPASPRMPTMRGDIRLAPGRKLLAPKAKDLPVMGTAAGATANNGFEITSQIVEYVSRPAALEGVPDAYAIYVIGESMVPEHNPGDLRVVHPFRPYKRGDSIVIQAQPPEATQPEGYIRRFVRETPTELIALQHNPPTEISYLKSTIVSVHKVLSQNELL